MKRLRLALLATLLVLLIPRGTYAQVPSCIQTYGPSQGISYDDSVPQITVIVPPDAAGPAFTNIVGNTEQAIGAWNDACGGFHGRCRR